MGTGVEWHFVPHMESLLLRHVRGMCELRRIDADSRLPVSEINQSFRMGGLAQEGSHGHCKVEMISEGFPHPQNHVHFPNEPRILPCLRRKGSACEARSPLLSKKNVADATGKSP